MNELNKRLIINIISCYNCDKNINVIDCFRLDYPTFCCGECYWSNWFRKRDNKKSNELDKMTTSNNSDNELDKKVIFIPQSRQSKTNMNF